MPVLNFQKGNERMNTKLLRNNQVLRILLLLGVPLITTLVLLSGTVALHLPSFSLLSFAQAMTLPSTCANTQGAQQNLCEGQSPVTQGCIQDAQTIEHQSVYFQNTLIGEVNIRHSDTCDTYWIRTIAYANVTPQVQSVSAIISLNGKVHESKEKSSPRGQRMIAETNMLFWPFTQKLRVAPSFSGVYHLGGQNPPITIPL